MLTFNCKVYAVLRISSVFWRKEEFDLNSTTNTVGRGEEWRRGGAEGNTTKFLYNLGNTKAALLLKALTTRVAEKTFCRSLPRLHKLTPLTFTFGPVILSLVLSPTITLLSSSTEPMRIAFYFVCLLNILLMSIY